MLVQEKSKLIGSVAKESGVSIKTIRYYDELGLLKVSGRTEGGFRLFDSDVLARLHFIKRAQSLGLSLSEIKDFLDVHDGGELPCEHIKPKLQDKLIAIDEQIRQLFILRQELQGLLLDWDTIPESSEQTICPILNELK
ncbi:heavy metal-responsive transcriptional regulator [Scytonema hofmannii FACHB-248]|uniref:Heavy metal-responsive transcriptional regulator n=1 Tax=Scytonema hofmannii FACHB-248 TaxID=1842502 RepID=A0ABR8H1D7_9CYAN|nr:MULTISPECIES: heavy metal-responsive transcriptional regulator [Nostocales]MBD2609364.1 heavy metal-responsive transcriptional regulator [Scytonema hofmannii FACHB-248]